MKSMCIKCHMSHYSGAHFVLRLVPNSQESFVSGCSLCLLKLWVENHDLKSLEVQYTPSADDLLENFVIDILPLVVIH